MKKLVGLFASVALMTSGAALANAQGEQVDQPSTSSQSGQEQGGTGGAGMGTSGQMEQAGAQAGANELTGQVLKSDKKNVFIKGADGAVISLKVDKQTQFTDPSVKSAKNLQPGQEIRASFKVEGTENIATSIQPSAGMGGSGVMTPDTGINQPSQPGEDQGGSGMEQGQESGSDIGGSQSGGSEQGY